MKGIRSELVTVVKNGISCNGFSLITESNIAPVVYFSETETVEQYMDRVNEAISNIPYFNLDELKHKEYILKNIYVSVQRSSESMYVKKKIMNLECILRVRVDCTPYEQGSIKVTKSFLSMSGIPEYTAWEYANKNTLSSLMVRNMADFLDLPNESLHEMPLYVVTTKRCVDGASALLYPILFKEFCKKKNTQSVLILPSSTEEVIIFPDEENMRYEDLANMVGDINNAQVDPLIQLDPVVYRYDIRSDQIRIVAEV
jgi:hypothetical protein